MIVPEPHQITELLKRLFDDLDYKVQILSKFLLIKLGYPPLQYANRSADRKKYIQAMNKADNNDFSELQNFIASELDKAIDAM